MRKIYTQDITGGSLIKYDGIYNGICYIHKVEQLFFKTYML